MGYYVGPTNLIRWRNYFVYLIQTAKIFGVLINLMSLHQRKMVSLSFVNKNTLIFLFIILHNAAEIINILGHHYVT